MTNTTDLERALTALRAALPEGWQTYGPVEHSTHPGLWLALANPGPPDPDDGLAECMGLGDTPAEAVVNLCGKIELALFAAGFRATARDHEHSTDPRDRAIVEHAGWLATVHAQIAAGVGHEGDMLQAPGHLAALEAAQAALAAGRPLPRALIQRDD